MIKLSARAWAEFVGVMLLIALAIYAYVQIGKAAVARYQEQRALERVDSLMKHQAVDDTVYKHDTLRVVKWDTAYRYQHDTLLLNVHDTVQVIKFVHVADSTIHACSLALAACNRERLVADSIADEWHAAYLAQLHTRPSPVLSTAKLLGAGALGFALRALTHK